MQALGADVRDGELLVAVVAAAIETMPLDAVVTVKPRKTTWLALET